jgi:acetolactate synthase-1/2/3 large subunit
VPFSREELKEAAAILRSGEPCGLFLGGRALLARGLDAAGKLAAAGVRVFANRYSARLEAGGGRYSPPRLPYFPEPAEEALAGLKHLILVESLQPVSFFGYAGRKGTMAPEDCAIHELEGGSEALEALAAEFGRDAVCAANPPADPGDVPLTPQALGLILPGLLPEDAILSDEMVSSGEPVARYLASAPAHDLLPVTGGSIGQGLPVALGAAVACPGRKVIALEADGSAMYTPQTLWTMAREDLDVIVVILANRRYRILDIEMRRTGAGEAGPAAGRMLDLGSPGLDWVKLAEGMGVPGWLAGTTAAFAEAFREALTRRGPSLIEARLALY